MSTDFHERFEREALPLPSDRSTGLVLAAASLGVSILWRASPVVWMPAAAVAAALAGLALVRPIWLRPLNLAWMRLALLLSKVMNPVVMLVLFAVAIVPAGLLMRLRYDPLNRKGIVQPNGSYWIVRPRDTDASAGMANQF